MNSFWNRVLPLMSKRNISQVDIGNHVGKPKATVNSWIKRGVIPDGEITLAISELLNVSVAYLIKGESEESEPSDRRRKLHRWIDNLTEEELEDLDRYLDLLESGAIVTSLRNKKAGE